MKVSLVYPNLRGINMLPAAIGLMSAVFNVEEIQAPKRLRIISAGSAVVKSHSALTSTPPMVE